MAQDCTENSRKANLEEPREHIQPREELVLPFHSFFYSIFKKKEQKPSNSPHKAMTSVCWHFIVAENFVSQSTFTTNPENPSCFKMSQRKTFITQWLLLLFEPAPLSPNRNTKTSTCHGSEGFRFSVPSRRCQHHFSATERETEVQRDPMSRLPGFILLPTLRGHSG